MFSYNDCTSVSSFDETSNSAFQINSKNRRNQKITSSNMARISCPVYCGEDVCVCVHMCTYGVRGFSVTTKAKNESTDVSLRPFG